jgi:ADP-ribose pyrophosphatase YjhB (NUDIX family)
MGRPIPARVASVETSAGGVVVRSINGVPHVLIIRDPYKKWGLPKGHVEEGEEPPETALREVSEETGLRDLEVGQELVTIDWFFHARGQRVHKFTTFYLMYSSVGDPTPEKGEGISACDWVPLASAHERISYDNASEVVRVAQRVLGDSNVAEAAE